jgi:hypothetical protein
MKPIGIVGVALVMLGLMALAYQGLDYTTPIPPLAGAAAVGTWLVLILAASRRS